MDESTERGSQQEGTGESTGGEPIYGREICPDWEPDCLTPAGTGMGFSARIYDSNSLGDRAKEGRRSERRQAGIGEEIIACMHVANSHGDWQGRGGLQKQSQAQRKFVVGEGGVLRDVGGLCPMCEPWQRSVECDA